MPVGNWDWQHCGEPWSPLSALLHLCTSASFILLPAHLLLLTFYPCGCLCFHHIGGWRRAVLVKEELLYIDAPQGFLNSSIGKESSGIQCRKPRFNSWVRKIRWKRDRLPTPVFLGFLCGSAGNESACTAGDLGSIHGLGGPPREGKNYPLQYSGLENSIGLNRVGYDWVTFSFTLMHPSVWKPDYSKTSLRSGSD